MNGELGGPGRKFAEVSQGRLESLPYVSLHPRGVANTDALEYHLRQSEQSK